MPHKIGAGERNVTDFKKVSYEGRRGWASVYAYLFEDVVKYVFYHPLPPTNFFKYSLPQAKKYWGPFFQKFDGFLKI